MRKYYSIFRPSIVDIGRKTLLMTVSGFALTAMAQVSTGQEITVTGNVTADSTLLATNPPSPLTTDQVLNVGNTADGTLTIEKGGQVKINPTAQDSMNIGFAVGTKGEVLVRGVGSLLDNLHDLKVGAGGSGTLRVEDRGLVTSGRNIFVGGSALGSMSNIIVSGPGSRLETRGFDIFVGDVGAGTLLIKNGGTVVSARDVGIAMGEGTTSSTLVTGVGSNLLVGALLSVGEDGIGILKIENGGGVTVGEAAYIGEKTTGRGSVRVDEPGAIFSVSQLMSVGYAGVGTLDVTNGGSVNTGQSTLGDVFGSTGSASVTGLGSQWSTKTALTVANAGTGTLNVSKGGVVTSQTATIASRDGSVGTINIGPEGSFQTGDITFGAGKGTINFDTAGDYEFASAMSGAGNLNVKSGHVSLTGNSSAFTGKTQVSDKSVLSVNGALGGAIDVLRGGTLGGIGTVGSMTIEDLAILAPGNSIGTMHVNGDLTFSPGSTYRVETSADGTSDKTLVSGVAALNGAHVQVEADAGNWQPSTTYTILTATGGVSGKFSDVESNLYFLDPEIGYPDANTVILSLKRNEIAADPIIDRIIDGDPNHPLVDNILTLDKKNAPRTTAQLPGRIYGSLAGVLLDDSRFINEAVNNRMRSAFGVSSTPMPVLAFGPDGAELQAATTDRFALWAQGFGSWMDKESDAAFAGLDRSIGGVFAGGDAAIGDHTRLGLVGGYSQADLDEPDLATRASVDSYYAGVYGGTELGAVNLRSGASYTWHKIGIDRQVQFTRSREYLSADYHAGTAQAFGEIGYNIKTANVDLEPFANLAYANARSGAFTETGGTAALSGSVSTNDVTYSTLGLRASTELSLGFADARLRGTAAWRHAYGDITPVSSAAFAGAEAFDISGLPIARDAAWLEAGLDVDVARDTTIGLSYQGQLANKVHDHGFMANFNVRF